MATYTTNLNLKKPAQSDKIRIADINNNMDDIDAAFGAIGSDSVATQIGNIQGALAIVAVGDSHATVTAGQFVYVRSHETLDAGLYVASANIAENGALSLSNLTADSSGGLNALNSKIATINENVLFKAYSFSVTGSTSVWTSPIRYKDVTIELPHVPSSPNQIYAISHNNQFWVASVTGADNSKNVTLRILTVATSDLSGIVTVWYQS